MAEKAVEKADALYASQKYDEAALYYDEAVKLDGDNGELLLRRTTNNLKRKLYHEVLPDAKICLKLNSKSPLAYFNKGIALFYLDEFFAALNSFKKAKKYGQGGCDLWIRKCEAEIELEDQDSEEEETMKVEPAKVPETPCVPLPAVPLAEKVKESWYQTATAVKVTYFAKKLNKENVNCAFARDKLSVKLTMPDGSIYIKERALFDVVDPTACSWNVSPYKVELTLAKVGSLSWESLDQNVAKTQEGVKKRENLIGDRKVYSSSKQPKDWEKLDKEIEKTEEVKPEGEAALHALFKQIYGNANDETKRAMMKSYQTSGGTVLSTNWGEVKDKDYEKEITPPKGQEVRKWNE